MRKYLAVTLLLLFTFSMLGSVQTAHATSPIGLDQKTVNVNVADLDVGAYAGFSGTITSWKDGDEFIVTIDGEMGVSMIGDIIFYMPYWLDDSKDSVVTNVEYSQYDGVGTANVLVGNEQVTCLLGGWAGWNIHIECCFANYGDSSVVMSVQACAGENDDWEDVELSLTKVKAFLYLSALYDGTIIPLGNYGYDYGEVVTVTVTYSGLRFVCWFLDGEAYSENPITVTMDSDHNLRALFTDGGGGGGGGTCPTLFVWNGTAFVEEGLLDIHAYSDVTVYHEIENTLALENGFYNLQLRELDNNTSHIDQVKLYAVDYEGEWHLCPLTYAYHSELGKVKHTLRFDDDSRVDLEPMETIDLNFALSTPYGETAYFIFEINGYNPKNPTPR